MDELFNILEQVTRLRKNLILSESRVRGLAYARFYLIHVLHDVYGVDQSTISSILNRTPSSINHSLKTIEQLIGQDRHFKETLQKIVDLCPKEIPNLQRTKELTNRELLITLIEKVNQLDIRIQNLKL